MNERGKYIYISIWCNTQNRLNKQITTEVIKQEKEKKRKEKQNKTNNITRCLAMKNSNPVAQVHH